MSSWMYDVHYGQGLCKRALKAFKLPHLDIENALSIHWHYGAIIDKYVNNSILIYNDYAAIDMCR